MYLISRQHKRLSLQLPLENERTRMIANMYNSAIVVTDRRTVTDVRKFRLFSVGIDQQLPTVT